MTTWPFLFQTTLAKKSHMKSSGLSDIKQSIVDSACKHAWYMLLLPLLFLLVPPYSPFSSFSPLPLITFLCGVECNYNAVVTFIFISIT